MSARIIVADDEAVLRTNLCEILKREGYHATGVGDGQTALSKILHDEFDVLIADIRMPKMDGVTLLKRVAAERPETLVLLVTAYASVESAVEALRFGAYDYLLKPIVFEDLLQKVHNLLSYRELKEEVIRLRRDLQQQLGYEGIIGGSPSIRAVTELVDRAAPTPSTVLITGESGTGKELIARALHARSPLAERPFLPVNVAAIPSEMMEPQLYGHERGAFTGAHARRDGVLRHARGGTVFLDEVGELPAPSQAKLLRALDSGEVFPVGADRPVHADFRLIAATNRNLEQAVERGEFRQDLFYRLNVFRIELPPLRDRRDDLPELAQHFLKLHSRAGDAPAGITAEALRLLMAYNWPGNVRELSNVIERGVILAAGLPIAPAHLPTELQGGRAPMALKEAVEEAERQHIRWVLRAAGGNREKAARWLKVDRATLYRRLDKYGLK